MARDAVMAHAIARNASRGVVLIAGNGHVRRDLGVPYWLDDALRARTVAIGYREYGRTQDAADARDDKVTFDAVVRTAAAKRADPCIEFTRRAKPT
jgi:uncharacterized iron-regulated protein